MTPRQTELPKRRGRSAAALPLAAILALAAPSAGRAAPERLEWVPVRESSLVVPTGSPLDFSFLGGDEAAGTQGRVVATGTGHLALAQRAHEPLRFHCASLAWSPASGSFPDHATADLYASQLRRHGYNLARFHFVDAMLMTDRDRDFDYDPVQLDRFRYLMAALKRNGIYWMIDVLTSQNGAKGGVYPHRWEDRHSLKLDVHFDPAARAHWHRLAETLLAAENPYTGLAPLEDPALALVILVNENGIEFATILEEPRSGRDYPERLQAPFNAWLEAKYATTAALRAAWGDLEPGETLETASVQLPAGRRERGARMRDLQHFFLASETATLAWATAEIRALGYEGLVSAYNNWATAEAELARGALPVVTMNAYHDEVLSFDPGTSITQASSFAEALTYVRELIGARWLGRPFVVSEHQHLFWNRYRYESGLAVPAYAALQGWDGVCRHGPGAIDLTFDQHAPHKQRILPYAIGLDPVARASETLAALLFRRGDVAPARRSVGIPFGGEGSFNDDGQGQLPDDVTKLGLVTAIGLDDHADARAAALLARQLEELQRKERDAGGIFESDTGEIRLDVGEKRMTVVTPRTEAAAFASLDGALRLGQLTIKAASGPSLVAVSALDGRDIADSRKLLLILATDARNSSMRFAGSGERTILDFGKMPVEIRRGTAELDLGIWDANGPVWLTTLGLDGREWSQEAVPRDGGSLRVRLDNAATKRGPTTFFVLSR